MSNVLIAGDTVRTPELRHEVPLGIPDPFLYAEVDGSRVVVISSMEVARVEALGTDLEVRPTEDFGADELRRSGLDGYAYRNELSLRIVRGLGIERATVPLGFPTGVADALRSDKIELIVDQKLFDDRRRVKSAHELSGIRRAQAATEAAMEVARDLLRSAERSNGVLAVDGNELTCEALKNHIQAELVTRGAICPDLIASHGPQTAIGHDAGSGPIGADDVVLVDIFPVDLESACFADMTRTFAVGETSDEIRSWYALCREALDRAVAAVRPGVLGRDLHRLVSELFADHGLPTQLTKRDGEVLRDGFYHSLGHGVGLQAHEAPSLGMLGEELVPGDVLAIEPGLYRAGFGGVRLEDLVLVTEDGCERLTNFPYDLEG